MSTARTRCVALMGLEGRLIEVEASVAGGLPRTVLVGLPDASLYEARDRCRAAASSQELAWPQGLVTINLSPASLPKAGSHYDAAIMAAVLAAAGVVPEQALERVVLLGELSLDGRLRAVRGLLPAVLGAVQAGYRRVVVPRDQVREARLAPGADVTGVGCLREMVAFLRGQEVPQTGLEIVSEAPEPMVGAPDLADVIGQSEACWAAEVAAAGGHHLFLGGPPGVGKSMLASRIPTILPELSVDEALEVAAVRSLAGVGDGEWSVRPPWSNPHHSASMASLLGGGSRVPRPGAISLAHRGVLFLDEASEFQQKVLDSLREPLETGEIFLTRSVHQATYPARFQLVLASNPCPCGYHGVAGGRCACPPQKVRRYQDRLSGPIMDRIDIQQQMLPVGRALINPAHADGGRERSADVAQRVCAARERQLRRLAGTGWRTNGEVPGAFLRTEWPTPGGMGLLDGPLRRGTLSARGVDKTVRVAWTVADLSGHDKPTEQDMWVALGLRQGLPQREAV